MARLTYGQLEQVWIQGGGSRALAPLMAAIAMAESGGDAGATNPTDNNGTQTSWGLWQISDGTHNMPSADILTPLGNARAAVAKYKSQGLGAWGTYTSGAYRVFYRGSVPPGQLPQGGTGGGGGGGDPQQAQLASLWSDVSGFDPLHPIWTAISDLFKAGVKSDPLGAIVRLLAMIVSALDWFFVPSHWARLAAFLFGLILGIPGLYALVKTGSGGQYGDVSLALGILLVTISGMCFFIAFHNLPPDVKNISDLTGWISASVREGKPATWPPAQGVNA